MTPGGGYGEATDPTEAAVRLKPRELRIIRAALSFVMDGDDSAWESLGLVDLDAARDLLDALPEFDPADDDGEEPDEDEDYA